jgi:hypothetical protein
MVAPGIPLFWMLMTRVDIKFALRGPLNETLMERLAQAHAIYGIQKIRVAPGLDALTVEYDATRLRPAEVHSALASAGIPVDSMEAKG